MLVGHKVGLDSAEKVVRMVTRWEDLAFEVGVLQKALQHNSYSFVSTPDNDHSCNRLILSVFELAALGAFHQCDPKFIVRMGRLCHLTKVNVMFEELCDAPASKDYLQRIKLRPADGNK